MFRFNLPGLIMGILAGCLWGALSSFGVQDPLGIYLAMALLFIMDILYRLRTDEEGIWKWLDGKSGGFLGIAPVWIFAIIISTLTATGFI